MNKKCQLGYREVPESGLTIVIKPTHNCNLVCEYCYVSEYAASGRMDEETLENSITKIVEFNGKNRESHFIWHGGEPLLMGLKFFQKISEIEDGFRPEYKITNSIQTNGTLMNEEIVSFCEEQGFSIGFSLDGPPETNDSIRKYCKGGKGSFRETYRAINLVQDRKMGAGIVTVLNKKNISDIGEIYLFFKENKTSFQVNPFIKSGRAIGNYSRLGITPLEYGTAMISLFDMWFYDKEPTISIDPLTEIIGNLLTGSPRQCNYRECCYNEFISVGPTGDVYPCGRFDGIEEFKLGNINLNNMEQISCSKGYQELSLRSTATVKGCSLCEYKNICNAGCMHNAYMVKENIMDKDYYCVGYKMLFKHISLALHEELKKGEVN